MTPRLGLLETTAEPGAPFVLVGVQFLMQRRKVAPGHVLAVNDIGYKPGVIYALRWFAQNYFSDKVRWCEVGGNA